MLKGSVGKEGWEENDTLGREKKGKEKYGGRRGDKHYFKLV